MTWKVQIVRQKKLLLILPSKMQESIKSQVLVSLTDKNESTVPRYSQWQQRKVAKPVSNKLVLSKKVEFNENLEFA